MRDDSGGMREHGMGVLWLSPWITFAILLSSALAALLTAFFPTVPIPALQRYGYIVAALLIGAGGFYEIWRRRHRPPPPPPPPAPLATALLRSFLPFERGDTLIGRHGDVADALAILRASDFRFGVVWGESGCGKTSFLRAGLVPALADGGHTPLYLPRPGDDPVAALEQALRAGAGVGATRTFVIVDQFEEYFLTHAGQAGAATLGTGIRLLLDAHPACAVVLAIRREFFARLQNLAPAIDNPTATRTTYELGNLSLEAARAVLAQAAASETVQFEADLVDAIIADLDADGQVWPVELQLLGTRLKRARVREKSVYVALGRKRGVIGTFIRDEVARLPKPILGEIVLRKLCAPGALTKSPVDISLDDLATDVRARDPTLMAGADLATCLRLLQDARVVIQTGDASFNLAHDVLAPLIQRDTTGLQGQAEAADRSISFYLGAFRHDRTVRIPVRTLLQIRRYGPAPALADRQVRQLMRKSWRSAAMAAGLPGVSVVVALAGLGYAIALSTWSVGTTPSTLASGVPSIAVRSGNPWTRFLPGTDRVIAETALGIDQIDTANTMAPTRVPRGEIWGYGDLRQAMARIAEVVDPNSRIALLRLAGQPALAAAAFETVARMQNRNDFTLKAGADSLGIVGRANGDAAADALAQTLAGAAGRTPGAPWQATLPSDLALLRLGESRPVARQRVAITLPQTLALLQQRLAEIRASGGQLFPGTTTTLLGSALDQLAMNGLAQPGETDLLALERIIDDGHNDVWVRSKLIRSLARYAARNAALAAPALAYLLQRLATAPTAAQGTQLDWAMVQALESLAGDYPDAARHAPVEAILAAAPAVSARLAIGLSRLARVEPALLPPAFRQALQARADDANAAPALRAIAPLALLQASGANAVRLPGAPLQAVLARLRNAAAPGTVDPIYPWREAVGAIADLAGAGQVDTAAAQLALQALVRLVGHQDDLAMEVELNPPGRTSDMALTRLLRAGAHLDAGLLDMLVASVDAPQGFRADYEAADMLIVAAKTAPAAVLARQGKLDYASSRPQPFRMTDRELRARLLAAYGRADAATGEKNGRFELCKTSLANGRDAQAWQRGAYCMFFSALDRPATLAGVQTYLRQVAQTGAPHGMAARMAAEMLVDAQRVLDARTDAARAPLIRARLVYDRETQETHVAIAAQAALLALADSGN